MAKIGALGVANPWWEPCVLASEAVTTINLLVHLQNRDPYNPYHNCCQRHHERSVMRSTCRTDITERSTSSTGMTWTLLHQSQHPALLHKWCFQERNNTTVSSSSDLEPDLRGSPGAARAIRESLHKRCLNQSNDVDRRHHPPNGSIFTDNYVSSTRLYIHTCISSFQPNLAIVP
jgi:hypothetical protein